MINDNRWDASNPDLNEVRDAVRNGVEWRRQVPKESLDHLIESNEMMKDGERAAFERALLTYALDEAESTDAEVIRKSRERVMALYDARAASQATVTKPIGYLAAYEVSRLESGHDGRLRSAKFGPSTLDGDIPVFARAAAPQAGALTDEQINGIADDHRDESGEVVPLTFARALLAVTQGGNQ